MGSKARADRVRALRSRRSGLFWSPLAWRGALQMTMRLAMRAIVAHLGVDAHTYSAHARALPRTNRDTYARRSVRTGNPGAIRRMAESNKQPVTIEDEMRRSYLDYAMSVIIGRAIPDVRDGLKPVHRRILYSMHEQKVAHERPATKRAPVSLVTSSVSITRMGTSAVYDSLVRMAQDFSMRVALGRRPRQLRFGRRRPGLRRCVTPRCGWRVSRRSSLADIEKETVDFGPNFDDSEREPLVLPSRVPNLLVNGSGGIAVGMATNIPPHNLQARWSTRRFGSSKTPSSPSTTSCKDDPGDRASGREGSRLPDRWATSTVASGIALDAYEHRPRTHS